MKKGISLIVLVITIIVMIVIAGAIILSLSSSNVTGKANLATLASDRANIQSEYAVKLAENTTADNATPSITEDMWEPWPAGNAYGDWQLGTNGVVYFVINADKTADFEKAYGATITVGTTVGTYDWLVSALPEDVDHAE